MTSRIVAALLACAATPALAVQSEAPAQPSVEGYLCTFAGKCDGAEAPVATRDAPETRGFRIVQPGAAAETPVRTQNQASTRRATRAAVAAAREARERRASYGTTRPSAAVRASSAAPVPNVGRGTRADLMIAFELNSDQLTPEGRDAARVFAQSLLTPQLRDKRFLIEGHTDERGGQAINGPLSTRRAQRVAEFLQAQGVDPTRLQTRGFGSKAPLPGRSARDPSNRRVEAELLS